MIKLWTLKDRENRGRTLREEDNFLLWFVIFGRVYLGITVSNVWIFGGNSYIFSREVPGDCRYIYSPEVPIYKIPLVSSKKLRFYSIFYTGQPPWKVGFFKIKNYQHYFFNVRNLQTRGCICLFSDEHIKNTATEPDFLT